MLLKKRKREECSGISCDVVASTAGIRRVAVCSIFFCFFTISFFLLLGKPIQLVTFIAGQTCRAILCMLKEK